MDASTSAARWRRLALLALGTLFVATRVAAVYTSTVNWDEFALLARADEALASGVFRSGGRPGLGVVLTLPFAADCGDEVAAIRQARLLWIGFTAAFLLGVAVLLARLQRDPRERLGDALLGVGLLALVPAFLEWSVQVRTDQVALAGGIWGAVLLLDSRRRPRAALWAGMLLGLGQLASQKLWYVAALGGLLALCDQLRSRDWRIGRDVVRGAGVVAGYAAVVLSFRLGVEAFFELPATATVREAVTSPERIQITVATHFDFMRRTIGFQQYREMLPTLVPHALLLLALAAASASALRARRFGAELATAWAVLALGTTVLAFHASAFFYFWMTLGLFPAVAIGVARTRVADELLPQGDRPRALAAAALTAGLLLPAGLHTARLLVDTQAVQRESFAFLRRNFPPSAAGFHPEGGLFCQDGVQPIDVYLSEEIYRTFGTGDAERRIDWMIGDFQRAGIRFLLQSFRLNQFPVELRRFWADNYQPYRASVFVAGRRLAGEAGEQSEFELIVPGRYRWLPIPDPRPLEIDGAPVRAGEVLELDAGPHRARFVEDVPSGLLVLAVNELPGEAPLAFYQKP